MIKKILFILLLLLFVSIVYCENCVISTGEAQIVNGDVAKARDEAIIDAKNNAVEKSFGVFLTRDMIGSNQKVISDLILTKSTGFISDTKVIENSEKIYELEGYKMLSLEISCHIRQASIWTNLNNIEALYTTMGKPTFKIISDNDVLTTMLTEKLKGFSFIVLDSNDNKVPNIKVMGTLESECSKGEKSLLPGINDIFFAKSLLNVKFVNRDGEVIFNLKSPINSQGKSFFSENEAVNKSIANGCDILFDKYAERFNENIINGWINELNGGKRYYLYFNELTFGEFEKKMSKLKDQRFFLDMLNENYNYKEKRAYVEVYFKADKKYMENMMKTVFKTNYNLK